MTSKQVNLIINGTIKITIIKQSIRITIIKLSIRITITLYKYLLIKYYKQNTIKSYLNKNSL